jgi:uncharacterized protein (TIGR03118 family)
MKINTSTKRWLLLAFLLSSFTAVSTLRAAEAFDWTNLVSDINGVTHHPDPNLVNSWGVTPGLNGSFWVADNGSGKITVYDGRGNPFPKVSPIVISVPGPGGTGAGTPTGLVLNPNGFGAHATADFTITAGANSGPAQYLTATEDGTIAGVNLSVDSANAVIAVDNSASGTAVYKGLTLGFDGHGNHRLYVANFRAGTIDVFDNNFNLLTGTGFIDPNPPAVPGGGTFAPFNIVSVPLRSQTTTQYFLVSYAVQDAAKHDDASGLGRGFIDVFDANGNFVKRLVDAVPGTGPLNSPWAMVVARPPFGRADGTLLVGNFGDGTIQRFGLGSTNPAGLTGRFQGSLNDRKGNPLVFDGLWGLAFAARINANGVTVAAPSVALYFAAGISGEEHGLFGVIVHRR